MNGVRDRCEAYCEARELAAYLEHSGRDVPGERAPRDRAWIENEFADLCSGDALDALRRERDAASFASLREGFARLVHLVETAALDARARPRLARLAELRARGGRLDQVAELQEEHFVRQGEERARLGHASGRARAEARLPGVDWDAWVARAERFLAETDAVYRGELASVLPRLGLDPRQLRASDEPWIDHLGRRFDVHFRDAEKWACAEHALDGMGLAPARVTSLVLDDAPRASRRASVERFSLHVPGEIVVSYGMTGGPSAYASCFFALARALSHCFTSAELPLERRRPHDRAVDRAWGWLLSDRWGDSAWLADFPCGRDSDALARGLRLRLSFSRRRCAGLVGVSRSLAMLPGGSSPNALRGELSSALRHATGVELEPEEVFDRVDAELAVVDELRGRCLAAQLAEHLRRKYGRRFWRERATGELLKELWHTGSTYTAESLASELGLGELDVDALIRESLATG